MMKKNNTQNNDNLFTPLSAFPDRTIRPFGASKAALLLTANSRCLLYVIPAAVRNLPLADVPSPWSS